MRTLYLLLLELLLEQAKKQRGACVGDGQMPGERSEVTATARFDPG
jgi:hypothetical protein